MLNEFLVPAPSTGNYEPTSFFELLFTKLMRHFLIMARAIAKEVKSKS
jgi:hypothetical protein